MPAPATMVESYLHARGITLPVPPSLRFIPDCLYVNDGEPRQNLPAMVGCIQIDKQAIGVHRTYLATSGDAKAGVRAAKKMLGAAKGGAVRFGPAAPRIGLAEGIETALSAMQADRITVWAALSTIGLKEVVLPAEVREVVIYADGDEAGRAAAEALARRLLLSGLRVEIKVAPDGKDFNNLTPDEIRATAADVREPGRSAVQLPTIEVDRDRGDLAMIVEQGLAALKAANDPPRWFISSTSNRPVTTNWAVKVNGYEAPEFKIYPWDTHAVRFALAEAARWLTYRTKGFDVVFPPNDIARAIYAQLWRILPTLRGVIYAQAWSKGGLSAPGYSTETELWCAADAHDDQMTLHQAKALIEEMLCDFSFASRADKAHAISLFLLPFMRDLIQGPTPIYDIEAPRAGTGKGLLARALLTPSGTYRLTPEVSKEEFDKTLSSALISGKPVFLLDNVHDSVSSSRLASVATAWPGTDIRNFGTLTDVYVKRIPIIVITANNPTFSEENRRRTARIRIDSNREHPDLLPATAFAHRLDSWVAEQREGLACAARTIIQAWIDAGRPYLESDIGWGSFDRWFEVMGGVTEWAGWLGLGETRLEEIVVDSGERRMWELVEKWGEAYGSIEKKAGDLVFFIDGNIGDFWGEHEAKNKARVLGRMLIQRRGQIFGKWKIIGRSVNNSISWSLQPLEVNDFIREANKF